MDLGGGSGYSTADQSMAASGTTGSVSSGFSGPSGDGGDNNDPYQGFVQASQPRGLSAIERAVQNTVQRTKDFLSKPTNRRGILGSLIGGALFGPFGAILGGSLGQRYGGAISNRFQNNTQMGSNTEIDMLTRAGLLPNQFTMPEPQPGIIGIDIPNFDPDMNLYATRPTSGYETKEGKEQRDKAMEEFYKENPQFRPPEQSGIGQLQFIV